MSDPACGVEPYKFGGAQKVGQTPQPGQVICVYTEGQKVGLTPQVGHCVNMIVVNLSNLLVGLHIIQPHSIKTFVK